MYTYCKYISVNAWNKSDGKLTCFKRLPVILYACIRFFLFTAHNNITIFTGGEICSVPSIPKPEQRPGVHPRLCPALSTLVKPFLFMSIPVLVCLFNLLTCLGVPYHCDVNAHTALSKVVAVFKLTINMIKNITVGVGVEVGW